MNDAKMETQMFNNEDIRAYRDISAPEGLRERVLASAAVETRKKPIILSAPFRSIAAIAACFVFAVLVMIPMLAGGGTEVYFNGERLGDDGIAIAAENNGIMPIEARAMGLEVSVTLDADSQCTVSVSEGRVGDTMLSYMGEEASVAGDATLRWIIDLPDSDKTYFMTVETEDDSFVLELGFGESGWEISRTEKSN